MTFKAFTRECFYRVIQVVTTCKLISKSINNFDLSGGRI
jgi:hypothetical protein